MKNRTKGIVKMVSVAMLALLGVGGWAQTARATGGDMAEDQGSTAPAAGKAKHELTGTVSSIDKTNGNLIILDQRGNRTSVQVPESMRDFDKVKEGDKVTIDYHQSMAVALTKPGEAPKKGAPNKTATNQPGGASCGGVTEVAGNVVSVDENAGEVTFRSAGGDLRTVSTSHFPAVQDKLSGLHPGDLIQVSYTQPVATKITSTRHH